MRLYNTLTRKIEKFEPLDPPKVSFYSCGPTVYDYTHIGHMRTYTNNDILKRALTYFGYQVKHVMNITDVGHLTFDDDRGEDKLEKGAKKEGKTVWEVANFYTDFFLKTLESLNITKPTIICKATDHIQDMINLIKILQNKGYTYQTKEALYFDSSKFLSYGKLSGQKFEEKLKKARQEVYIDPEKKSQADFTLWFKRVGRFKNHSMHWNSPWGDGFPGWHIECSAMSMKYLGETIDIHTGGIEHIPVHHENEIAQSEGATGIPFVRFWVHNHHLQVDGKKMSKSLGNFYTIEDMIKKGINPLALRLLFLQTHYRQPMNFTWQSAQSAEESYQKLKEYVISLRKQTNRTALSEEKLNKLDLYRQKFTQAVSYDLQMSQAVAVVWDMLKSNIPADDKLDLLYEFDQIMGLKLNEITEQTIPSEIIALAEQREKARKKGDFILSDKLRNQLRQKGYIIEDRKEGYTIKIKN